MYLFAYNFLFRTMIEYQWAVQSENVGEQWSDHALVCYKYLRRSGFPRTVALLSIENAVPEALWDGETDVPASSKDDGEEHKDTPARKRTKNSSSGIKC